MFNWNIEELQFFLFPELHCIAWFLPYVYFHQSFSHGVGMNVNKVSKKLAPFRGLKSILYKNKMQQPAKKQLRKTEISQNVIKTYLSFLMRS